MLPIRNPGVAYSDRYLIHTKDLRKDGPVTKVPIYMTGLL